MQVWTKTKEVCIFWTVAKNVIFLLAPGDVPYIFFRKEKIELVYSENYIVYFHLFY